MKLDYIQILVFIILVNLNLIKSNSTFDIYIDYESNVPYDYYECGSGSTPCVSFRDAAIKANNIFGLTSSIAFNVIINDLENGLEINEPYYIGYLLYFENITISIVDKNLNRIIGDSSKLIVRGSLSRLNFLVTSDEGNIYNKRSNILIEGIEFSDWGYGSKGYGSYPLVLNSTLDKVVLNHVKFSNSEYLVYFGLPINQYLLYDTKQVQVNNCVFENCKLRNFYVKSEMINFNNSTFKSNQYGIEGNSKKTIFDQCTFVNNNIQDEGYALINNYNSDNYIQVSNSIISDNTISMILSFDFENVTTKTDINILNCTLSDNEFKTIKTNDTHSINYLIHVISPMDGWKVNIQDTIITRSNETNSTACDGLIGISSTIGKINLQNLSIINYSFKNLFNVNKYANITIFNSSTINYKNNSIYMDYKFGSNNNFENDYDYGEINGVNNQIITHYIFYICCVITFLFISF